MPDFWQFPTVSMGLAPLMAIYQARFNRYLEDRGLLDPDARVKVWALLGDGEMDEPEALGAISLAAREKLDNLIFVVNCNLQRLDGPVRGNGKIIQELEAVFRGAGWNVIKVIWGDDWDPLFAKDHDGLLLKRVGDIVDGNIRSLRSKAAPISVHIFLALMHAYGTWPNTFPMNNCGRCGVVGMILRKSMRPTKPPWSTRARRRSFSPKPLRATDWGNTAKGAMSRINRKCSTRQNCGNSVPALAFLSPMQTLPKAPFYRPPEESPEIQYLHERRQSLGGYVPQRQVECAPLRIPAASVFEEFYRGTEDRAVSTTMVYVRLLSKLLRNKDIGRLIVPIVPDEARTFGMEALFRQCGIYSHVGQLYEPVDADSLLYYKEAKDGQILEEGITEAGSMASFIAAGTAYATHGINTIPFFIYYSMFGFQRIGDLIWAAADMRCKGFLLGATAGRTTLAGEGLQHQDGHSHLLAYPVPNLLAYDPAFGYELAVIIREGMRRMYTAQEDVFYYLTVTNQNYPMPSMPEGEDVPEGILRGLYRFRPTAHPQAQAASPALWQWRDYERGVRGPAPARCTLRGGRGCVECDEL